MRKVAREVIAAVRSAYPELTALFRRRMEEEGYPSLSAYFFWLGFYDLILRKPHHVTAELAHQSPERQETAVRIIIENFESGPKPGGFFESHLHRVVEEEKWKLHAEVRVLKERVQELERELATRPQA